MTSVSTAVRDALDTLPPHGGCGVPPQKRTTTSHSTNSTLPGGEPAKLLVPRSPSNGGGWEPSGETDSRREPEGYQRRRVSKEGVVGRASRPRRESRTIRGRKRRTSTRTSTESVCPCVNPTDCALRARAGPADRNPTTAALPRAGLARYLTKAGKCLEDRWMCLTSLTLVSPGVKYFAEEVN